MLPPLIMRRRPRFIPLTLLAFALLSQVSPRAVEARTFTLIELLEFARRNNPGVAASMQATQRIEAQLSEANRSWQPTGQILSMLAPVPEIRCSDAAGERSNTQNCISTNVKEISTKFKGVFTRTELNLVQPVYTFGKISAGKAAATSGVAASKGQQAGIVADLELNVRKAYYGLKLARGVLATFDEGVGYLDDAQKQIETDLKEGTGTATQTDKLRLITVRAELNIRRLETEKLGGEARAGLRALLGPEAPANIEIDAEELTPLPVADQSMTHYEEQARQHRPELLALDNLVAAKRSLADLERRKQYPDFVLLGSATYARASSIDDPDNAFFNDPFNQVGVGLAAAVRLPLDLGVRNARAAQAEAEAEETELRRREALSGVRYEVQKAYGALSEVKKRLVEVRTGERASKAWITAIAHNLAAGLAETRDFTDALVSFFQFRVRVLQAAFDLNMAAATLARTTGVDVAGQAEAAAAKAAAANRAAEEAEAAAAKAAEEAEPAEPAPAKPEPTTPAKPKPKAKP